MHNTSGHSVCRKLLRDSQWNSTMQTENSWITRETKGPDRPGALLACHGKTLSDSQAGQVACVSLSAAIPKLLSVIIMKFQKHHEIMCACANKWARCRQHLRQCCACKVEGMSRTPNAAAVVAVAAATAAAVAAVFGFTAVPAAATLCKARLQLSAWTVRV